MSALDAAKQIAFYNHPKGGYEKLFLFFILPLFCIKMGCDMVLKKINILYYLFVLIYLYSITTRNEDILCTMTRN